MIVMSNFASTAALMNRRREAEAAAKSKYKVVRIFVNNEPDKFGVWLDDGKPSWGRRPVKIFDTEAEAKAFAFPKKA